MRKKVFFTGGLLALFLLISSNTAFAQSLALSSDEIATIKTEIQSGKSVRDVLKEHNISMDKIRAALGSTPLGKERAKLSNTQIASIATKLGLDPQVVQSEIDQGKTLKDILKAHNITEEKIRAAFEEVVGKPLHAKAMNGKHKKHR